MRDVDGGITCCRYRIRNNHRLSGDAGMTPGFDVLAGAKYPSLVKHHWPKGFACGVFSKGPRNDLFGDSRAMVDSIVDPENCPKVRVQLDYKANHDFSPSDFPGLVKEAKSWLPIINNHPNVGWYISGACENNLSKHDATKLAHMIKKVVPVCTYVNSGSARIDVPGAINEGHGSEARPIPGGFSFSFDGSACVDSDVETIKTRLALAEIFFFWEPRFNGRWETNDTTPIALRHGYPDAKLFASVKALWQPKGNVHLPDGWIYKSHSENKGTGEVRAEKPVMIAPVNVSALKLKNSTGAVLATLPYYGPYQGGGHRYYATKWGYEIGNEVVTVWGDGKKYGTINPSFRENLYR